MGDHISKSQAVIDHKTHGFADDGGSEFAQIPGKRNCPKVDGIPMVAHILPDQVVRNKLLAPCRLSGKGCWVKSK